MRSRARWIVAICATTALTVAIAPTASAAAKPANATAQCKDGSYSQAKTERGACSDHGGVANWYGAPSKTEAKAPAKETRTETANAGKTAKPVAKDAAPADSTGRCQDGTYTRAKSERGACSGHGGVATWTSDTASTKGPAAGTVVARRPAAPSAPPPAAERPPAPAPSTASPMPKAGGIQAPPADAPPNATAQCNDGTFSMARQHRGACSSHKGVKAWFK